MVERCYWGMAFQVSLVALCCRNRFSSACRDQFKCAKQRSVQLGQKSPPSPRYADYYVGFGGIMLRRSFSVPRGRRGRTWSQRNKFHVCLEMF